MKILKLCVVLKNIGKYFESMNKNNRRVLVILGLPEEAGGTGHSGLDYSCWNNVKYFEKQDNLDVCLLVDNSLNFKKMRESINLDLIQPNVTWLRYIHLAPPALIKSLSDFYVRRHLYAAGRMMWYYLAIKNYKPNLIHVHGALRCHMVNLLKIQIPVLTTLHGALKLNSFVDDSLKTIEKDALSVSDYLVTVTEDTFTIAGEPFHGKARWVIPNGVDKDIMNKNVDPLRFEKDKITLLTVGSLTDRKNQMAVLEGIHKSGHANSYRYVTIGGGPNAEAYKIRAAKYGIEYQNEPFVSLMELGHWYRAADYHILISRSEGFGMCIAESLACGTPVIISKAMDISKETSIINDHNSIVLNDSTSEDLSPVLTNIAEHKLCFDRASIDYPYDWKMVASMYRDVYLRILQPNNHDH